MNAIRLFSAGLIFCASALAASAETKVELKGTHLCCGQCVAAVGNILKKVEGCTGKCDQKAGTVSITAKDDATAQKAIDALAAGGFHGTTDSKAVTMKDDSGVTAGKVKTLTLEGVHNCCGACNTAIVKALGKVEGVKGNTAKVRATSFDVTGEFDAEAVVKAMFEAGYHCKVKK